MLERIGALGVVAVMVWTGLSLSGCKRDAERSERYLGGLPLDRPWDVDDYVAARDALVRIDTEAPDLLPRETAPGAKVFAKLSSVRGLDATVARLREEKNGVDLIRLVDALKQVYKLYASRVERGHRFGDEVLAISVVEIRLSRRMLEALPEVVGIGLADIQHDEVRLDGLLKARWGSGTFVLAALGMPLEAPRLVDPAEAAKRFAVVADDMAAMMLPEERDAALGLCDKLAAAGGAGDSLDQIRAALLGSTATLDVVSVLERQHRAYSRKQTNQMADAVAKAAEPVKIGADGPWTRYSFPGKAFSASFPAQPAATTDVRTATDGADVSFRTLKHETPRELELSALCVSRDTRPPEPFSSRAILADQGAKEIVSVSVGSFKGHEGAVDSPKARTVMRVYDGGKTFCVVGAEYPKHLGAAGANDARRFVESFAPGEP